MSLSEQLNSSPILKRDGGCPSSSEYDGLMGLRILSIFIILISSSFGAFFPVVMQACSNSKILKGENSRKSLKVFMFLGKNFGSGVIFATAFIHLLASGYQELTAECLGGAWQEYPMAFAICMFSIFVLYLIEIISRHYVDMYIENSSGGPSHSHGNFDFLMKDDVHTHGHQQGTGEEGGEHLGNTENALVTGDNKEDLEKQIQATQENGVGNNVEIDSLSDEESVFNVENMTHKEYINQIFALFVLEFGIIFHSVWVGLSVGVAGSEFKVLFVVIIFHQMFEGLGLGTRIAECKWPKSKKNTPFYMAGAYGLVTPISIAIGVGVRHSLNMDSLALNIVSGVADSISGGILMYNSFEILFSAFNEYPGNLKMKLLSYFTTCWGVGLMALLGKWA